MPGEEHDDGIVDEMPEAGGAPCGDIFGATDAVYLTDADEEDDMPAPDARCGDPFADSQLVQPTDADDAT